MNLPPFPDCSSSGHPRTRGATDGVPQRSRLFQTVPAAFRNGPERCGTLRNTAEQPREWSREEGNRTTAPGNGRRIRCTPSPLTTCAPAIDKIKKIKKIAKRIKQSSVESRTAQAFASCGRL